MLQADELVGRVTQSPTTWDANGPNMRATSKPATCVWSRKDTGKQANAKSTVRGSPAPLIKPRRSLPARGNASAKARHRLGINNRSLPRGMSSVQQQNHLQRPA